MKIAFTDEITAELVDSMGDEKSIVRAARVSTLGAESGAEEDAGLIRFLMREGHGTPFEAPTMTFRIHAPIFVTRQILKHRISSINEESGRYRELEPVFYVPANERKVKQIGKTGDYEFVKDDYLSVAAQGGIRKISFAAWREYEFLIREGVAKEVARMVLPTNLYSTLYMTANLRSWLNFVKLRTYGHGSHPQYEIAEVGDQVAREIADMFPTVWGQFSATQKVV